MKKVGQGDGIETRSVMLFRTSERKRGERERERERERGERERERERME